MSILDGSLNQIATYWPPTNSKSRYGRLQLAAPLSINVRWEDRNELFLDTDGNETRSVARVYSKTVLEEGGWLYLGQTEVATPQEATGAKQIRQIRNSPSLANDDTVIRAIL